MVQKKPVECCWSHAAKIVAQLEAFLQLDAIAHISRYLIPVQMYHC